MERFSHTDRYRDVQRQQRKALKNQNSMKFPFIPKATSQVCAIRLRLLANLCFTRSLCVLYRYISYITFTCCAIKSYKKFRDTPKKKKFCLKNILFHVRKPRKVSRQYISRGKKIFFCYFRAFLIRSSLCYCCALLFLLPRIIV